MSIESKNKLKWSDIESIYSSLNKVRKEHFKMSKITIPDREKKRSVPSDATSLEDEIIAMKDNDYITQAIKDKKLKIPDISDPEFKELIYPDIFKDMKDIVDDLWDVCLFDACFTPVDSFPTFSSASCPGDFTWNPSGGFGSNAGGETAHFSG